MSWKSIDMQLALNRVPDAGKLQEQLMKENQQFQESLSEKKRKQDDEIRKRVNTYENVDKGTIEDEEDKHQKEENNKDNPFYEDEYDAEEQATHPYLGKKIDYSG